MFKATLFIPRFSQDRLRRLSLRSTNALRAFFPLQISLTKKRPASADLFFKWRSCRIVQSSAFHPSILSGPPSASFASLHKRPSGILTTPDFAHKKKGQLLLTFFLNGDPGAIRTPDPQLRRLLLYPAELQDHVGVHITKLN